MSSSGQNAKPYTARIFWAAFGILIDVCAAKGWVSLGLAIVITVGCLFGVLATYSSQKKKEQ